MNPGAGEDRWGGPAAANLKWETTNQFNLGLDAAFFNNRVNLVVDLYYKKTTDLLQYRYIDMSSGFNQIACNYGDVTNKGLEITAHVIPVKTRDWMWTLDANISFNRNTVDKLDGSDSMIATSGWGVSIGSDDYRAIVGKSIGQIYGYKQDGFYSFDDFTFNEETKRWIIKPGRRPIASATFTSGSSCNFSSDTAFIIPVAFN